MIRKQRNYAILLICATASIMVGCKKDTSTQDKYAYRREGIAYFEKENYKQAADTFQKALSCANGKVTETEIDICYYKADAQQKMGDIEGAIESYNALIRYDNKQKNAYYLRGSLELLTGDKEQALADFDKSLEEGSLELYYGVCQQLVEAGESEEAEKYCKKAVQLVPTTDKEHTLVGRMYLLLKEYDNAEDQLEEGADAGDKDAYLYLAEACYAQDAQDEAKSYYQQYAQSNSDDGDALNQIGELLMSRELYEEALQYFQEAQQAQNVTDLERIRKNEIIAMEKLGDFADAKEKIESFTQDYPENKTAQREAAFLATR